MPCNSVLSPRTAADVASEATFDSVVATLVAEAGECYPEHPCVLPVLLGSKPMSSSGDRCGSHTEPSVAAFEAVAGRQQEKLLEWLDCRMKKMEFMLIGALDQRFQDLALRVQDLATSQPCDSPLQCAPASFARVSAVGPMDAKENIAILSHYAIRTLEEEEVISAAGESRDSFCNSAIILRNHHNSFCKSAIISEVGVSEQNLEKPVGPCSNRLEGPLSDDDRLPNRQSVGRSEWFVQRLSDDDSCIEEIQGFQRPRCYGSYLFAVVVNFYWPAVVARSKLKKIKLDYINLRGKLRALSTMIEADQAVVYDMNHKKSAGTNVSDNDGGLDDNTKERVAEFARTALEKLYRNLRSHQNLFWYAGVPLDKFVEENEDDRQLIIESDSTTRMLWELGRLVAEVDELSLYIGAAIDRADQLPLKLALLFSSSFGALSNLVTLMWSCQFSLTCIFGFDQ